MTRKELELHLINVAPLAEIKYQTLTAEWKSAILARRESKSHEQVGAEVVAT